MTFKKLGVFGARPAPTHPWGFGNQSFALEIPLIRWQYYSSLVVTEFTQQEQRDFSQTEYWYLSIALGFKLLAASPNAPDEQTVTAQLERLEQENQDSPTILFVFFSFS